MPTLPFLPRQGLYTVICIDCRVDPAQILGIELGYEVLAHIWPTHHENVHFYGTHSVDIEGELVQFDAAATGRCANR